MYWFFLTLILLHLTFQRDFLPRSRAIIIMHHKAIFLVMATLANGAPMKIIFTLILFSSAANSIPAEDTLHLPSEKESHSYTTSLALFLPFLPLPLWTPFSKVDYKFPLGEIKVQRTPTENNFVCQSDSIKN